MSENRFSTMFKFSFRREKDKKFVSLPFRNTYNVHVIFACLLSDQTVCFLKTLTKQH